METLVCELTLEQRKATDAMKAAEQWATELGLFMTPTQLVADAAADHDLNDQFFAGVEALAQDYFGGGHDLEAEITKRTGWTFHSDRRFSELYGLHLEDRRAAMMAAFALGVAWRQPA
jgi:hypothetical protein